MANAIKTLLLCAVIASYSAAQNYIGRTCNPDQDDLDKYGQCIESDDCGDDGTFTPGSGTPAMDKDNVSGCPSHLACCVPRGAPPTTPLPPVGCGWLQPGIGDAAPGLARLREVPWTVGIYVPVNMVNGNHRMKFYANGVLIQSRVVLTVAHKVQNYLAYVGTGVGAYAVVGEYHQGGTRQTRKAMKIQEVVLHPLFNLDTAENNLALVFLQSSVPTSLRHVSPACLPSAREVQDGAPCFFTGWGRASDDRHQSVLTKTSAPKMSRVPCSLSLRPYLGPYYSVPASLTCAGGERDRDVCTGDAGSPLVCPVEGQPGRYELTGLMAYVASGCPRGLPAVFADVAHARSWIENTLASKGLAVPV